MSNEINRIKWKCRRGMREIDLLLREFSKNSIKNLSNNDLSLFDEILDYDDQKLYDFIFKNHPIGNKDHESFIIKNLKTFTEQMKLFAPDHLALLREYYLYPAGLPYQLQNYH